MKKTILRKYAHLIAAKGGNVQKGQDVLIYASLDQPEFVKMVAEECYRAGAARVVVDCAVALVLCDMLAQRFGTDWLRADH